MIPLRTWATPLTIGAFILMAVTGMLLFFEVSTGLNKAAHEWLSWAFVIGAAAHITINFTSIKRHLAVNSSRAIIGVFVLLLAGSFLSFGGGGGGSPVRAVMMGVSAAPLSSLAPVAGTTPDALVEKLRAAGYAVNDGTQSLRAIVGDEREDQNRALVLIFDKPRK